jgi:peptidoglycan/xylan/chitin deacetylase (PgdA/CDA1 family)
MSPWRSLSLFTYYYASCPGRWWLNRAAAARHRLPVTVLFYHRVADDETDETAVSNRVFAEQIRWLEEHVDLVSLDEARRRIAEADNARLCASLTFDDGYADNCREAIPLLVRRRIPCTYFVTVRNVLEGRPFRHDLARGRRFPPNSPDEIRAMAAAGIEIGSHSSTHADLGSISDQRVLEEEIGGSRETLQDLLGRPVRYFAFPFGDRRNLSVRAFELAFAAGYEAACSAYGGYNLAGDDPFHLQRICADRCLLRLKNRATIDPRRVGVRRFPYAPPRRDSAGRARPRHGADLLPAAGGNLLPLAAQGADAVSPLPALSGFPLGAAADQ